MDHSLKLESSHQQYKENPNVIYPNGESLSRPMKVPASSRWKAVIVIAAACVIAAVLLFMYFDATFNEPMREQERIQEELGKDIQLQLPSLLSFIGLDDAQIIQKVESTGDTLYEQDKTAEGGDLEIMRIPPDMTLPDAAALYAAGLNKLTALQAVTLLNGSWSLNVDRRDGLNMSIHYADFDSGSLEEAIAAAIEEEQFDRGGESDSGDDDGFGNVYSTGTVMVAGELYSWTVSAIPLDRIYSISGLPENAIYVGIRVKGA